MKRTLLFIACVLASLTMLAQEEISPEVSDVQNSGCTNRTRASVSQTLVMTKEGEIVTCEINGIVANCGVSYFDIQPKYITGKDAPDSLFINVTPVVPYEMDCTCPYNVSFTIRNVKSDSFYLFSFPYAGMMSFKESNQTMLELSYELVTIDGSQYYLFKPGLQAQLSQMGRLQGEVQIPSTVSYDGQDYTVSSFDPDAIGGNAMTTLFIPKTISNLGIGEFVNLFNARNPSIESFEVESGCPVLSAIDGVLYSGDRKTLYCLPAGKKLTDYSVIDGVEKIGMYAFSYCPNLKTIRLPKSVTTIRPYAFINSKDLESIYISGKLNRDLSVEAFLNMSSTVTLYVPESDVDFYKAIYKGPVYPLPEAQDDSEHLLCDGRSWKYEHSETDWQNLTEEQIMNGDYHSLGRITNSYLLRVDGNELFDGRQCKKIIYDGFKGTGLYGYGYEEDGRVMVYALEDEPAFWAPFPTEQWVMLYDFNVAKDSHCDMGAFWHRDLIVSVEGTVKVGGTDKRFVGLSNAQHPTWPLRYVVDGIGCSSGLYEFENIIDDGSSSRFVGCYDGDVCIFSAEDFKALTTPKDAYRPFIEDGKVWKLGDDSGNPVQRVEYYYFDGDTIVDGKTCKQMMCQRFVNPDHSDYAYMSQFPSLSYVGAWYEADKKVYFYNALSKQYRLWYDFSINANDTLWIDIYPYIVGPRQTGGIKGFKGVYRDVMIPWEEEQNIYNSTWLEGVGNIEGPIYNVYYGEEYHELFLMSCTVGDEVIYLNDDYEDGATPAEARKRFDFTHTIKTQPKAPRKWTGARASLPAEADQSLYGEYNNLQLGINLDPLVDAYLVRITDESGKVVYEKAINAGSIVGLNIDISAYAAGRYTVTVENAQESFTGEFETQTSGISDALRPNNNEVIKRNVYNLQGQRISSLQKGLNIVNGQKIYVK